MRAKVSRMQLPAKPAQRPAGRGWKDWNSAALWRCAFGLALVGVSVLSAAGQLTVTPGRVTATTAGTGTAGYSGDSGVAASARLASPSAVAYDRSGNLFVADTANHLIREVVKSSGTIVTVAGSGMAGFAGDGGAATSALLDTPTGVAVDSNGILYIADSHNARIRRVAGGIISTVAGTGVSGFSGDGGAAASAQLASPSGVAVDTSDNLYIADTGNHRVRRVAGVIITTVAGTGDQGFSGDGGAATSATLDAPASVAVDAAGNLYIADRHNQRIRVVGTNGTITTFAGSGTPGFSGGFAGDGAAATAAALSRPSGVSVDSAGNVYIADANNQRVRTVTAGVITTAFGNGSQGFSGDGGRPDAASLDTPKSVAIDSNGNFALADSMNHRIRSAADATIAFASSAVGTSSATQGITLTNAGSVDLTIASAVVSGPFVVTGSSTCAAVPFTLSAGTSCTEVLAFAPTQAGVANGSIAFAGPGAAPQTILLSAVAGAAGTTTTLTSSANPAVESLPVTFTATVAAASGPKPTGSVVFSEGSTVLATVALTNGVASFTSTALPPGNHVLSAAYQGNGNDAPSTGTVTETIVSGATFTLSDAGLSSYAATVPRGFAAQTSVTVTPGPTFSGVVTFSCTGLPANTSCEFTPPSLTFTRGGLAQNSTLLLRSASLNLQAAGIRGNQTTRLAAVLWGPVLLLAGVGARSRGKFASSCRRLLCFVFLGGVCIATLTGCGSGARPLYTTTQAAPGTYNFKIVATGNGVSQMLPASLTIQ